MANREASKQKIISTHHPLSHQSSTRHPFITMLEADYYKHESPAVVLKYDVLASAGSLRRWHVSSLRHDCSYYGCW